jgi:hypothetical protein
MTSSPASFRRAIEPEPVSDWPSTVLNRYSSSLLLMKPRVSVTVANFFISDNDYALHLKQEVVQRIRIPPELSPRHGSTPRSMRCCLCALLTDTKDEEFRQPDQRKPHVADQHGIVHVVLAHGRTTTSEENALSWVILHRGTARTPVKGIFRRISVQELPSLDLTTTRWLPFSVVSLMNIESRRPLTYFHFR